MKSGRGGWRGQARTGRFSSQPLQLRNESWKPVKGFVEYYVSNLGRIKTIKTKPPRIMSPSHSGNIVLRKNRTSFNFKIAQLILRMFIGTPPRNKYLARHLDDNPQNNKLTNLAWGDHQDNYNDGVKNERHGPNTKGAKLRGKKLKGIPRPDWVKKKISRTKQRFPERQNYGRQHGPDGRFIGDIQ